MQRHAWNSISGLHVPVCLFQCYKHGLLKTVPVWDIFTLFVIILIENNTLGVFPVLNGHKVWYEAGNAALHDGIVSQNDVFREASDTVRLVDHWNQVSQLISSAERERECLWLIVPDFPLDNNVLRLLLYPCQVSCPQSSSSSTIETKSSLKLWVLLHFTLTKHRR